jgi:hypothetical protein
MSNLGTFRNMKSVYIRSGAYALVCKSLELTDRLLEHTDNEARRNDVGYFIEEVRRWEGVKEEQGDYVRYSRSNMPFQT